MSYAKPIARSDMDRVTAGLPTKSAKIRRLAAAGYETAEIARYLGIRYQFAYNVIHAPKVKACADQRRSRRMPIDDPATPSSDKSPISRDCIWTTVAKGGRIDLPADFLEAIGVREGDPVQIVLDGDIVRIQSRQGALREVQTFIHRRVPEGVSLVDELLEERRQEAAREERNGTHD